MTVFLSSWYLMSIKCNYSASWFIANDMQIISTIAVSDLLINIRQFDEAQMIDRRLNNCSIKLHWNYWILYPRPLWKWNEHKTINSMEETWRNWKMISVFIFYYGLYFVRESIFEKIWFCGTRRLFPFGFDLLSKRLIELIGIFFLYFICKAGRVWRMDKLP